jgi:hypothetical protein
MVLVKINGQKYMNHNNAIFALKKLDAKTYRKCDLVSHVNLIIALESKFKINIDD